MLRFGTDGVRGRVGVDLGLPDVESLGAAVAAEWPGSTIVIGHDGRESGDALVAAFAAGATAGGATVTGAGLLPTPALARVAHGNHCVAVAVTASHNPWQDNGVKVFAPGGRKLTDDEQVRIEARWHGSGPVGSSSSRPAVVVDDSIVAGYVAHLATGVGVADLAGTEVTVDCANGATSAVAGAVMEALEARTVLLNARPDGRNINDGCGAVHPEALAAECARRGTIGVAFDGDGDRLIAVGEDGRVVDGDRIIALLAIDLHERGLLAGGTVVVTTMTNLGFHRAMRLHGIEVVTTEVGDRAVSSAMERGGFVLGGEQSGHIISSIHATTGDGLLASILLLDLVRRRGTRLAGLAESVMHPVPQLLHNVRVATRPVDVELLLGEALSREREALGSEGRVVVRASGTEPVVRIMVEAPSIEVARGVAERLERVLVART